MAGVPIVTLWLVTARAEPTTPTTAVGGTSRVVVEISIALVPPLINTAQRPKT